MQGYEVLKHMQGVPEHGNPPPVIRLYVDLNLQTLVSADIVPQTSGSAENMPLPRPLAPLLTQVSTSASCLSARLLLQRSTLSANPSPGDHRSLSSYFSTHVQDREANSQSGQMPHLSPEPLQQRMPVEGASQQRQQRGTLLSMPIPAAAQPTPAVRWAA